MSAYEDKPDCGRRALAETLVLNRGALAMKTALTDLFACWDKVYAMPPGLDCARAAANKMAIQNARDALALATCDEAVEHILRNWREDVR